MEKLYLILGCFGRIDDNFTSCSSCESKILHVSEDLKHYKDIMAYFESVKLLDKPLLDYNTIRNSLFKMQANFDQDIKKLWSEKEFKLFENFTISHKSCGIYMQLLLEEDVPKAPEPENIVVIPATTDVKEEYKPPVTAPIFRGRR